MSATPTPTAPSTAAPTGAWRTLVRGISLSPRLRTGLPFTLLLALAATAGRAVVPVAVQRTIDDGLGGAGGGVDLDAVVRVVLWAALAVAVTAVASGWMNRRLVAVVEGSLADLRVAAFRHIHDLSMLHQSAHQRGALVSRVTGDIDEISRFMQWGGLNLITALGQLVVATIVMLAYSWQLTLVVLAVFVPFVLLARWFQRRLTVAYQVVRERVGRLLGLIAETVVGAPVVRAYGAQRRTREQLDTAIEGHRRSAIKAGRLSASFSGAGELFAAAATAGVLVVGVLLGVGSGVTTGTVIAFLFLVSLFVDPVMIASEVVNEAQTAVAGWRRVLDVLDIEPDVADPGPDGVDLSGGPIGFVFEGVSFRYPRPDEPARQATGPAVLHDVGVEVAAGSRTAVVGETGSGKTTFVRLLVRLMDPTTGTVRIGGQPADRIRFASLRRHVLLVPQDGILTAGSIADNVRMGRPEIDDAAIARAFDELGLGDWIAELPDGLDTPVGERGNDLSAGERQLVALARAHVVDPTLLVLDEALSAVDPATEIRLQRALVGVTRGRTTVLVAHRLSTAEQADDVLVFDHGRIVQRGPHAALLAEGGVYGRLHDSWTRGTRRDGR